MIESDVIEAGASAPINGLCDDLNLELIAGKKLPFIFRLSASYKLEQEVKEEALAAGAWRDIGAMAQRRNAERYVVWETGGMLGSCGYRLIDTQPREAGPGATAVRLRSRRLGRQGPVPRPACQGPAPPGGRGQPGGDRPAPRGTRTCGSGPAWMPDCQPPVCGHETGCHRRRPSPADLVPGRPTETISLRRWLPSAVGTLGSRKEQHSFPIPG